MIVTRGIPYHSILLPMHMATYTWPRPRDGVRARAYNTIQARSRVCICHLDGSCKPIDEDHYCTKVAMDLDLDLDLESYLAWGDL